MYTDGAKSPKWLYLLVLWENTLHVHNVQSHFFRLFLCVILRKSCFTFLINYFQKLRKFIKFNCTVQILISEICFLLSVIPLSVVCPCCKPKATKKYQILICWLWLVFTKKKPGLTHLINGTYTNFTLFVPCLIDSFYAYCEHYSYTCPA